MAKPTKLPEWDNTELNSIEPDQDHKDNGWLAPAGVPEKPPYQTFNFWQNNVWKWIQEINANGILLWDTATTYEITSYVVGSNGLLYKSLSGSNQGNDPISDTTNWKEIAPDINTSFKNKIINGNFDIWQRGISLTDPDREYTADRWFSDTIATVGAGTITRQAFTLGQTDVPGEPAFFLRHSQTTAASATIVYEEQKIEDVRTLAGKKAMLSFRAKADKTVNFEGFVIQNFGTGGSPSSSATVASLNFTVTTSWQKFEFELTFPSISGKTLGTDGNDHINIRPFRHGTGSGDFDIFDLDIAQVQLEEGPVATAFEQRPIGEELLLCQRYFEKSYDQGVDPGSVSTGGGVGFHARNSTSQLTAAQFRATKRTAPTVKVYSPATGAIDNIRNWSGAADIVAAGIGDIGESGFTNINLSSAPAATTALVYHYTADAEL